MSLDAAATPAPHHGAVASVRVDPTGTPSDSRNDAGPSRRQGLRDRWAWLSADLRAAVSMALGAVAVGVLVCVGLVVLGWASDAESATPWRQAVRVGVDVWLVAHLTPLDVVSHVATTTSPADPLTEVRSTLSLPPGGLLLAAALLAGRVGVVLGRRTGVLTAAASVGAAAAAYAGAAWLLAWAVDTPVAAPDPERAASGAAVLALVACCAGVVSTQAGSWLQRWPVAAQNQLRRVVPAAGVALTGWLTAGALLLGVALAADVGGVSDIATGVGAGPAGGALLLLGQLLFLPTLVVWAASLLAGPGVSLGAGDLDAGGSTVVDVPALPVLAALPDPGQFGVWVWGGSLLVVGCGALAGWHAHRHPSSRGATAVDRVADAAAVAALTGSAVLVLCLVTSGTVGPWGPLGPDPIAVAAAVTGEVFVGAVVASTALHLLAGRPLVRWSRPSLGSLPRPAVPQRLSRRVDGYGSSSWRRRE